MSRFFLIPVALCIFSNASSSFAQAPDTASDHNSSSNNIKSSSVFSPFLNSKCSEALDDAQSAAYWNQSYNDDAKKACLMLEQYLNEHHKSSHKEIKFTTYPSPPYYFMKVHLERELTPKYVIHTEKGVIERNDQDSLEAFVKHIHLLDTQESALHLAEMIHCFHASSPMSLVTSHQEKAHRAKQNPPVFIHNADGSVSLVYDLIHTGRSVSVSQCTLTVNRDYKVSLKCSEKPKD